MNKLKMFSIVIFILILLKSCNTSTLNNEIIIGNQTWMARNLNVETFRNGDHIFNAKTAEEWIRAGENEQPAWCYYDNNPANGEKFGKLYNWYAVIDQRGLAPDGWYIPSYEDWKQMLDYLGNGEKAIIKMKSKGDWVSNGNGTNESNFSGLPGGFRSPNGNFLQLGRTGNWWSSTKTYPLYAWDLNIDFRSDPADNLYGHKRSGLSVRCVR